MRKDTPKTILKDKNFKHLYREKNTLKSFLKGFFEHIHNKECLEEVTLQIEYIFKKKRMNSKEKRGDILVVTPNYIIDIEAQTSLNYKSLLKELTYISCMNADQLDEKEEYTEGKKIIGIIVAGHISRNLKLPKTWFQRYNYKSDAPEYKELPSNIEIYILDVDKAREIGYYEGENNLLLRHLQIIGESSLKKMKQIAREDEDLMILALNAAELRQMRKTKRWTSEEKERIIAYGDGVDDGMEKNKIEIAKKMLKDGATIDYISKITDLSIEKIESLQ